MTPTRLTPEQYLAIWERVQAGESVVRLAREHGMHTSQLSRMLKNREGHVPDRYWPPTLQLPADPAALAYIAGLFDGEGSLYRRSQDGAFYVKLAMTDRPVIEYLHSFGGTFTVEKRPAGRLTAYLWCVSRRKDLRLLLEALLPYLRVKRAIALEALAELP